MKNSGTWVAALVLALSMAACGGAAPSAPTAAPTAAATVAPTAAATVAPSAAKPTTVRIAVTGTFLTAAQPFLAKQFGFFEKNGVDAQLTIAPNLTGAQAVLAGSADFFVSGSTDVPLLAAKGEQFFAVVSFFNQQVHTLSVSRKTLANRGLTPTSPLADRLAALKGMKIAVSGSGSATDTTLAVMVRSAGLNDTDVQRISISGGQQGRQAALQQGQIDGYVAAPYADIQSEAAGDSYIFLRANELADFSKGFAYNVMYGTKKWVESNEATTKAVVKALVQANDLMIQDASIVDKLQQSEWKNVPADILTKAMATLRSTIPAKGAMTEAEWAAVSKYSLAGGLITAPMDTKEGAYWTNRYLP